MAKNKEASKSKAEASKAFVDDMKATIKKLNKARLEALELLKRPAPRFVMNGKERAAIKAAISVLEGALE